MVHAATAKIVPPTARAGEVGTWSLRYRVGAAGINAGDTLTVETDSDTDWEEPQVLDRDASGFVELVFPQEDADARPGVSAPYPPGLSAAVCVLTARRIEVRFMEGRLEPGREVSLVFGANCGMRMQTFVEERRYFHIRHIVVGKSRAEPEPVVVSAFLSVAGNEAVRLVLLSPSTGVSGERVGFVIKAEDCWGNPASGFDEPVTVSIDDASWEGTLPRDRAVTRIELPLPETGTTAVFRATASSASFAARGNPIAVAPRNAGPPRRQFWGDFHGGQLVDVNKIADFYRYGSEVSDLQFSSYQRNDHETTDEQWEAQKATDLQFYRPGRFVALPGYEWSADTRFGGDRNVLFPRHGLPLLRSSYSAVAGAERDESRELPDLKALHSHYRYSDAVLVPHVGGRESDITVHDPQLEPIVEIASTHGTFEWFYRDALRRGYKVGVVAGSDGYTGRPGGEYPGHVARRFSRGGSAAVRATDLTLHGVLEAARARRTYGTSGPRIYLDLRAGAVGMGEEIRTNSPVTLEVTVFGTNPVERIDLFRRDKLIQLFQPEAGRFAGRWRVIMEGAASWHCYSGVRWTGELRLADAEIRDLVPLRFDSPRSTVTATGPGAVRWDTTNCGYAHGFEFTPVGGAAVAGAPDPGQGHCFELSVATQLYNRMYSGAEVPGTMRISCAPGERGTLTGVMPASAGTHAEAPPCNSHTLYLGPAERAIRLEPVRENATEDVATTFIDENPQPGLNAYWVRVTQRDLHRAWSSPIFVHYEPHPL